jgi:hypothetical protein
MKKIIIVLALTIGVWAFEACLDCNCGAVLPYFEYSALFTETFINYGDNKLRIAVYPGEVNYIVEAPSLGLPGFCTAAYGCSCIDPGHLGAKYPLDSICITANRDFAADFPAGTPLNAYFKVTTTRIPASGGNEDTPIDPAIVFNLNALSNVEYYEFAAYDPLHLLLVKQPDTMPLEGFSFIITGYKSNGTTVTDTVPATRWQ